MQLAFWQTRANDQVANSIVKASENAEKHNTCSAKCIYLAKFEDFASDFVGSGSHTSDVPDLHQTLRVLAHTLLMYRILCTRYTSDVPDFCQKIAFYRQQNHVAAESKIQDASSEIWSGNLELVAVPVANSTAERKASAQTALRPALEPSLQQTLREAGPLLLALAFGRLDADLFRNPSAGCTPPERAGALRRMRWKAAAGTAGCKTSS